VYSLAAEPSPALKLVARAKSIASFLSKNNKEKKE
jgi:hypothetical protein